MNAPQSLFDRIWARHVIVAKPGGEELLFVDRNLVHEGGTFLAFDQMRAEGRTVRKPKQTLAVTDHYLPSTNRATAPAPKYPAWLRRSTPTRANSALSTTACIIRARASSTSSGPSSAGHSPGC